MEKVNPQLENGYLSIASGEKENDLFMALIDARLNSTEYQCVLLVIRKTWGYKKKEDWISISQFCGYTHKKRRQVIVALSSLVHKKLLVRKNALGKMASYSFNKIFTDWKPPVHKNAPVQKSVLGLVHKNAPTKETITKEKEIYIKKFQKPTMDQLTAYCTERGNSVDPKSFLDHYDTNGWMVGRSPMKNWEAAVRTWENKQRPPKYDWDKMTDIEIQQVIESMGMEQSGRFYDYLGEQIPW